jgi:magnesium transporter
MLVTLATHGFEVGRGGLVVLARRNWRLYRDGRWDSDIEYEEALAAARNGNGFVWIGLHHPGRHELDEVADEFHLHPLAVEGAVEAQLHPKVEHFGDVVFMALRTVGYVPHDESVPNEIVETGELMVFVGPYFAITVSHGEPDSVQPILARLEDPHILQHGSMAVLYVTADVIVDDYLDTAERFETDLTEIEGSVFVNIAGNQAERIYRAQRELLKLRRAIIPLGQPIRSLAQHQIAAIPVKIQAYFRDISDHLDRVHGLLAGYDEIINSMLQANLAQLSVAQNNDMRKITSWAAIVAVPTAIAGIYGMNFTDMPELDWSFGYPAALIAMGAMCMVLYWNFKRRGWL